MLFIFLLHFFVLNKNCCRWDHSEDYYFFRYKGQDKIYSNEYTVTITTADEEYEYMSGHVIDGKNLLPATGYLHLIWNMIGLLRGVDYCNIPIVFENVKFVRATHLSKQNKLELTLTIQKGKFFHNCLNYLHLLIVYIVIKF